MTPADCQKFCRTHLTIFKQFEKNFYRKLKKVWTKLKELWYYKQKSTFRYFSEKPEVTRS